ncbi:MAG TPA: LuxR C-terminal-related transcriptional regulator, partial [Spirochaetota bacterium]|nr:LuxR C-terminal-related transcriptional regulator [Spirochaetota bacterium]
MKLTDGSVANKVLSMNPLALISAFLAIATLLLAVYILHLDPKNLVHRLFFVMMILYSCWEFIYIGMQSTGDKQLFVLLYKMTTPALVFIPMTLHIIMLMVKMSRKIMAPILSAIYAAYVFFLYQNFNLNLINRDFTRVDGYWHFVRTDPGYVTVLYMIVYGLIILLCISLIINWHLKTGLTREKKQARILLLSLALLFVFTFIDYVIFFFTKNDLGIFAHYVCIWPVGIGVSIIRYRFLSVPPGLYSYEIFDNIGESVFVLDHDSEILFANSSARKTMAACAASPGRGGFDAGFGRVPEIAESMLQGEADSLLETLIMMNPDGSQSPYDARFTVINDRYDDRVGVLVIAQQMKGMKDFAAGYNITDRELDVIQCAAAGLSSREIADTLNISERTIQAHLAHIYNKLDVKNRVELINIFKG